MQGHENFAPLKILITFELHEEKEKGSKKESYKEAKEVSPTIVFSKRAVRLGERRVLLLI